MASLVKIAGRTFVFGLTWRSLYGNLPMQQRIGVLSRELGSKHYVLVDGDMGQEQAWAGFLTAADKSDLGARGTLYSPGALFALSGLTRDSAILFGQCAGGYYMVALRGGVPAAGYEIWSRDAADIDKRAQHFIEATGNGAIALLGRSTHFQTSPEPASLDLLCGDSQLLDHARLQSTEKIAPWKLAMLPALLILLVLGWQLRAYMQERTDRAVQELRNMQQTPDRLYRVSLASELSKGVVTARSYREQLQIMLKLPVDAGGWKLQQMFCDLKQCELSYKRQSGTYGSFPELEQVTVQHGKAGELESIHASKPLVLTLSQLQPHTWPREAAFLEEFGSRIQSWSGRGFNLKLGEAKPLALPEGIATSQIASAQLLKRGDWELSGPLWAMALLTELPDTLVVSDFKLNLQGSAGSFVTHGNYHVRADLT